MNSRYIVSISLLIPFLLSPLPATAQDECGQSCRVVKRELRALTAEIKKMQAATMVPFTIETDGGICNTAGEGSANPEIRIDSKGRNNFVVSSILLKTGLQGNGEEGYEYFSINSVIINGTIYDTKTDNLTAPVSGWGVNESVDLMGTPIMLRRGSRIPEEGGNFPTQITASGLTRNDFYRDRDIVVQLFCRADDFDFNIAKVRVSGWKPAPDRVTVKYIPGD